MDIMNIGLDITKGSRRWKKVGKPDKG